MSNNIGFGEKVPGYQILVMNEREIRAAAGLMFLATFISLMLIIFEGNFVPIKYVISIFLIDFSIRLFINPKFSPVLILGRFFVSNQNPEYVGAIQKKFAWYIGLILSATMFVLMVLMNTYSIITGIVCLICLILMFFETAFGICIGCKLYKIFKKEEAQYCPGEVCDIKAKQPIQKISQVQYLVVMGFTALVLLFSSLVIEKLQQKPVDLFKLGTVEKSK
ncbi:MAG TPA: DUF4395 domain-containing protein [Sediminibacterium sp.]|nr:MAG: hypothetical protein B7X72_10745 [Sphingobacteriia bacterium 39-39-8]HQS54481.1 DUF4395 domain-containing protein [Sediminibacterium sp.]